MSDPNPFDLSVLPECESTEAAPGVLAAMRARAQRQREIALRPLPTGPTDLYEDYVPGTPTEASACRFVDGRKHVRSLDPWCETHSRSASCCLRCRIEERDDARALLTAYSGALDEARAEIARLKVQVGVMRHALSASGDAQ